MRTSLARLVVLAGALAGLFAMHGLADHGVSHADSHQAHAPMASTSPTSPTSHGRGVGHGSVDADATVTAPVGTSSGADMGVMGLCLAVLAGALFFLVRRRAFTGVAVRLTRDLGCLAAAIGTTSRERDPPRLAQLSILRC